MRKQINWAEVERQYRAGIMSLRTIASGHGVTEGAIRKRANKEGWDRDLSAKIKQRCAFHATWTVIPSGTGRAFHAQLDSSRAASGW